MENLTEDQLIRAIALKATVQALKGKVTNTPWDRSEVLRWAKEFEEYIRSGK